MSKSERKIIVTGSARLDYYRKGGDSLANRYRHFHLHPFLLRELSPNAKNSDLDLLMKFGGFRFENLVASQLLKFCHFIEDTKGHAMELRFLRDTDGREVDFVVLKDHKPLFAVECKTGEKNISSSVSYFETRTEIPTFYQVHRGKKVYERRKVKVLPFLQFCDELEMP